MIDYSASAAISAGASTPFAGRSLVMYAALLFSGIGLFNNLPSATARPAGTAILSTGYTHRAWTTEDGLPQNTASSLVQTRDGYLWIGTYQGLVRFDGARFKVFEAATTEGLESDRIISLLEDRNGNLWIGTDTGGVSRYQDGRFTSFTEADGLPSRSVLRIFEDATGDIWVKTTAGLLVRTEHLEGRLRFVTDPRLSDTDGFAIHASLAEPGTLWAGTRQGVMRLRGNERVVIHEADNINSIAEQTDGTLWFGARDRIMRLQDGEFTAYTILQGHTGRLYVDRAGGVWAMATGGGLYYFHQEAFVRLLLPNDPIGTSVIDLIEDREGTLWVGTNAQGLHQLRKRLFTGFTDEDGLPGQQILGVFEDREGSMWAGTSRNGLVRLRDGAIRTYTRADGLPADRVWAMYADAGGDLWIGMETFFARFEGQVFEPVSTGRVTNTVRVFAPSASGHLWLGGNGGVWRLQNQQVLSVLDEQILPVGIVISLYEDSGGTLWIGTNGGGLCRYTPSQVLTCYTTADGLSNNIVRAIYPAAPGTLWIGTYGGGLCELMNAQFTCLTTLHGLPDGTVHTVIEDDLGFVWLPSNKGIFRLTRQELEQFFRGEVSQVYPDLYTAADGMPSTECNGGFQPAAWKAKDGRLWFPTTKGLAVVDPHTAARTQTAPDLPVYVEQLVVDGTPMPESANLTLAPGSDRLVFSFTTPYLSAPRKLRFRYRLRGHRDDWIEASGLRNATYTNLSPGKYTFEVEANVGSSAWQRGAMQFVLQPHFYQTVWFWGMCALVGLLATAGAYRRHLHNLKEQQRELEMLVAERTEGLRAEKRKTEAQARRLKVLDEAKNRFFANISHEFRTPLQLITGPLEEELARTDDPRLQQQLATAHRNAGRLLHLVNQLLDLAKLESGTMVLHPEPRDLAGFLQTLGRSFMPLAERKHINLHLSVGDTAQPYRFDADALEKIIGNLLANALKFTPEGGKVWVTLNAVPTESAVEITVKDTGPGIPATALPFIFERFRQVDDSAIRTHEGTGIGLALARELVELQGGHIFAESEPGFGTIFTVRLALPLYAGEVLETAPMNGEPARPPLPAYQAAELNTAGADAPTVLLVEDNAEVRQLVRGYLEPDYKVAEAEHGQSGLDAARKLHPDLILSDVMMPVMDGMAFVEALKADARLRAVPVILLTARADVKDKVAGLEAGADDYLPKPFTAAELRARVTRHIETRQQLRAQFSRELRVEPAGISVPAAEEAFLQDLLSVVEAQMADARFGAGALAEAMGISPRQLRRRLRATLGESPAAFIRRLRLERAAHLLEAHAGTVAEIAYRVGFNDPDYFSTAYRKHFGRAPTDTV